MFHLFGKAFFLFLLAASLPFGHGTLEHFSEVGEGDPSSLSGGSHIAKTEPRRRVVSNESEANMVNYDLETKSLSYEFFDEYSYEQRRSSTLNGLDGSRLKSKPFIPNGAGGGASLQAVIGGDGRTRVDNPTEWPYSCTVLIESIFYRDDGKEPYEKYGTGFLEGPNLLVTAAHCAYTNPKNQQERYDKNSRFADEINIYAGIDSKAYLFRGYRYFARVKKVNLEKRYKVAPNQKWDWCAIELDRDLGEDVGYYGKIGNWTSRNGNVFTYGYPSDKSFGMYETNGRLMGWDEGIYMTDLDSAEGQSGSPIFMRASDGGTFVCGILTHQPSASMTCGTCINDFIYNYLDSFVTEKNNHISLKVNSQGFLKWSIRISNSHTAALNISYRIKMCFLEDAKYWKGFDRSDIREIRIDAGSYKDVSISMNFAADSIAASYVAGSTRFVTYAKNLNSNGTLSEYHYWFDI